MIKNNNYLDSLSKSLLNDVRSVLEGKKGCSKDCKCEKCEEDEAEEKGEVKEAKKMKGEDPCWKDYKMVGTKKGKGGKEVPNCVPEEVQVNEVKVGTPEFEAHMKKHQEVMHKYGNKLVKTNDKYKGDPINGYVIGHDPKKQNHVMVSVDTTKGIVDKRNRTNKDFSVHVDHLKEAYDETAVNKAISSSRQKIGGREAKKIHALLKGSTGYAAKKNAEDTKKTFPNVKHLTKDGHPDWKKHGMDEEVQLDEEVDFAKVRKQFDRNEDRNAHSENAVLIAKHAGTEAHHKEAKDILKQHKKLGHLSGDLSNRRQALYKQLEKTDNYKKIFPEEFKESLDEAKMVYKKVLGQHTVHIDGKFHRSFPSEGDAVKYIQKNQSNEPKKKTYSYNEEVEIDEAKAESPIKGTRLISKHQGKDGHHAEVRHNSEYNEFQVHHYENGKHMGEGPVSYHDTKEDAKETAEYEVKNYRPKGGSLRKEETQTVVEKLIGNQHKLDKNKNGKLDKQDFKMIRKEETIEEKLSPSMGSAKYIDDFVKSKDPRFEGKTKKERIKMALGAYYGAKNESVEEIEEAKDSYGSKRDYAKHHISVNGKYVATTTWARNAKEAEKRFLEAHPEHKGARITVSKD